MRVTPRIFAIFLTAPFLIAYMAGIDPPERAVSWIRAATYYLAGFTVYTIGGLIVAERSVRRTGGAKLRQSGRDPDEFLLVMGLACCLAPASVSMILARLGLSLAQVYAYSVISFLGMLAWGWRYRSAIARRS